VFAGDRLLQSARRAHGIYIQLLRDVEPCEGIEGVEVGSHDLEFNKLWPLIAEKRLILVKSVAERP
jgi:hypothetical protein